MNMPIAQMYLIAMLALVLTLWAHEQWKIGWWALHGLGKCWIAMMRHTGDPRYTHQPRRYR